MSHKASKPWKIKENWQIFQHDLITLPCLIMRRKERVWVRDSFFLIFKFFPTLSSFYNPSKQTLFLLDVDHLLPNCAPPSTYNNFYGNHSSFFTLHQPNNMFLNNTFNTIRFRQRNKANICLHIYKTKFLSGYFTTFYLLLQSMLFWLY